MIGETAIDKQAYLQGFQEGMLVGDHVRMDIPRQVREKKTALELSTTALIFWTRSFSSPERMAVYRNHAAQAATWAVLKVLYDGDCTLKLASLERYVETAIVYCLCAGWTSNAADLARTGLALPKLSRYAKNRFKELLNQVQTLAQEADDIWGIKEQTPA